MGVILKGHTPGKWRMIKDLSYPPRVSINDSVKQELCSLTYITVDQVTTAASNLGRVVLLAKVDMDSAHQLVLVHPEDRSLLAIQWSSRVYVHMRLPFGLWSASAAL